jgi:hypothetical protein
MYGLSSQEYEQQFPALPSRQVMYPPVFSIHLKNVTGEILTLETNRHILADDFYQQVHQQFFAKTPMRQLLLFRQGEDNPLPTQPCYVLPVPHQVFTVRIDTSPFPFSIHAYWTDCDTVWVNGKYYQVLDLHLREKNEQEIEQELKQEKEYEPLMLRDPPQEQEEEQEEEEWEEKEEKQVEEKNKWVYERGFIAPEYNRYVYKHYLYAIEDLPHLRWRYGRYDSVGTCGAPDPARRISPGLGLVPETMLQHPYFHLHRGPRTQYFDQLLRREVQLYYERTNKW